MSTTEREQPLNVRIGQGGAATPEQARRVVGFAWRCVRGTPLADGQTPLALLRGRRALQDVLAEVGRWLDGEPVGEHLRAMHDEVFEAALGAGRFERDMTGPRAACWAAFELSQAALAAEEGALRAAARKAASAARTLSRVIRLCLRFGVGPVFIPAGEPQCNGSVENFNGWSQEPLLQRRSRRPADLRRELARLQEAVNTQHVHPRLGGQDAGAAPARPAAAPAAGELRGADGAAEAGGGARDVPAAGERGRGGGRAQPDIPGGEEAPGAVPAAGGGHRARVADGVPEWPRAEALAVQTAE